MQVLHNTCNMCIRGLPDMNALIPWVCGPWAYILGKSLMPITYAGMYVIHPLQLTHILM